MDGQRIKILSAQFLITAVAPEGYPPPRGPEVAFVGRSNVGKSSMINALCQRHKLVRVSNAPGRTRTLNFFDVVLEDEAHVRREVRFCDLPGYGFAKVSKAERKQWRSMIETYLHRRESLCSVVSIVDANVGASAEDLEVIPWLHAAGRRVIVAATKIDRLPKHQRVPRTRGLERDLDLDVGDVVGVSATERIELDALWGKILEACASARPLSS